MTDTNIISDIAASMTAYSRLSLAGNPDGTRLTSFQLRRAGQGQRDLMATAIQRFASINGWHTDRNVRAFNVEDIGKRQARSYLIDQGTDMFDHPVYYRGGGKCAAIVAQPYPHSHDDAADAAGILAITAKHGVACHIPPCARASFHYPGGVLFYVFTSLDHHIVWLPEQISGFSSDLAA
jgi:hypothetical protein